MLIVPMLDGRSEVFAVASLPTTGGKAQTYAITGPGPNNEFISVSVSWQSEVNATVLIGYLAL